MGGVAGVTLELKMWPWSCLCLLVLVSQPSFLLGQVCDPVKGAPGCVCMTSNGIISLTSLASTTSEPACVENCIFIVLRCNIPCVLSMLIRRFVASDFSQFEYEYNPCYGFSGLCETGDEVSVSSVCFSKEHSFPQQKYTYRLFRPIPVCVVLTDMPEESFRGRILLSCVCYRWRKHCRSREWYVYSVRRRRGWTVSLCMYTGVHIFTPLCEILSPYRLISLAHSLFPLPLSISHCHSTAQVNLICDQSATTPSFVAYGDSEQTLLYVWKICNIQCIFIIVLQCRHV